MQQNSRGQPGRYSHRHVLMCNAAHAQHASSRASPSPVQQAAMGGRKRAAVHKKSGDSHHAAARHDAQATAPVPTAGPSRRSGVRAPTAVGWLLRKWHT